MTPDSGGLQVSVVSEFNDSHPISKYRGKNRGLPNLFYNSVGILMPKLDKDIPKEKVRVPTINKN